MNLSTPVQRIPGIGPVYLKKLQKMGIKTIEDLLWHFPHRYEDFSNISPISKIKLNEKCCVLGKILSIENIRTFKRKMVLTEAIIGDKTGAVKVIWFNQPYLTNVLKQGDHICVAGKVSLGKDGLYFSNPVFEKFSEKETQKTIRLHTGRIVPVYPETEGLSSRWLRWILGVVLSRFKDRISETLPLDLIKEYNLMPLNQALWQIHFPDSLKLAEKARERFSFEELFLIELAVLKERWALNQEKAYAISMNVDLMRRFVNSLSFKLTDAQRKCIWQILKDMEKPRPMSRLLEGDVGSGKTVVAVAAILNAAKAGYQTAFMAPTEILAKQHFSEVSKLLHPFKIRVALLTGKTDKVVSLKLGHRTDKGFVPEVLEISRKKLIERTKKGEIDVVIGTHALIAGKSKRKTKRKSSSKERIVFNKLALCVVDEQHRFGVEQRAELAKTPKQDARIIPHFLSMTATPIPRSLALTIYGDLDLSVLDEMPKGRKRVITKIISPNEREKAYKFVTERIEKGEQVFVICPRIEGEISEEGEVSEQEKKEISSKRANSWADAKAVKQEYERLSKEVFPDFKIAMLHGRMKPKEKEKIMKEFRDGRIDILVSTSVVEVGVDVPKATIIIIEGAERFGLAQLHQFRGRVGRSDLQSYCFLFTESSSRKTKQRLQAILKAKTGFELAQKDLEIRGPGSLIGVKQWGMPDLAMENLKNIFLVEKTREAAKKLLGEDPYLKKYPILQQKIKRFRQRIHLE